MSLKPVQMQLVASQHLAESLCPHHDKASSFANFQTTAPPSPSRFDRRKDSGFFVMLAQLTRYFNRVTIMFGNRR
jgi:hypothetical protein